MSQEPTNRRRFLRRTAQIVVGGPTLLGCYVWRVEPHWVEVVHRELPIAGLPERLEGRTVAHLSDLHIGPIVDNDYLLSALDRTLRLEPAAIFITGDWMTCHDDEQIGKTLNTMAQIKPHRIPIFSVLGNHDYGQGFRRTHVADALSEGLRKLGITVLRNQVAQFEGLQIAGTDDLWSQQCRLQQTVSQLDPQQASIVLSHNPDTVDTRGWQDYRGWILAGHTHGGQCQAPGFGAPILPIRNRAYAAGEIDLGDGRRLYVNRALGYKRRVRFLARPEITLFRLMRSV